MFEEMNKNDMRKIDGGAVASKSIYTALIGNTLENVLSFYTSSGSSSRRSSRVAAGASGGGGANYDAVHYKRDLMR